MKIQQALNIIGKEVSRNQAYEKLNEALKVVAGAQKEISILNRKSTSLKSEINKLEIDIQKKTRQLSDIGKDIPKKQKVESEKHNKFMSDIFRERKITLEKYRKDMEALKAKYNRTKQEMEDYIKELTNERQKQERLLSSTLELVRKARSGLEKVA